MSFSENLVQLMEESKTSSYRLAKNIGVRVSTVTNWKNGSIPKIDKLQEIAHYFEMTVDELITAKEAAK